MGSGCCGDSGRGRWREERLEGVLRGTKGAFCSLPLAGRFILKRLTLLYKANDVPTIHKAQVLDFIILYNAT